MTKKLIDLDKEYHCSSNAMNVVSIETEDYIIEFKENMMAQIIRDHCIKHINNNSKDCSQRRKE